MAHYFPAPGAPAAYCNKPELYDEVVANIDKFATFGSITTDDLLSKMNRAGGKREAGDVKYIYVTKSGPGPLLQPADESLLSPATGLPVEPGPKHKRMIIEN